MRTSGKNPYMKGRKEIDEKMWLKLPITPEDEEEEEQITCPLCLELKPRLGKQILVCHHSDESEHAFILH